MTEKMEKEGTLLDRLIDTFDNWIQKLENDPDSQRITKERIEEMIAGLPTLEERYRKRPMPEHFVQHLRDKGLIRDNGLPIPEKVGALARELVDYYSLCVQESPHDPAEWDPELGGFILGEGGLVFPDSESETMDPGCYVALNDLFHSSPPPGLIQLDTPGVSATLRGSERHLDSLGSGRLLFVPDTPADDLPRELRVPRERKWEYLAVRVYLHDKVLNEELSKLGGDGWELDHLERVGTETVLLIMRRLP